VAGGNLIPGDLEVDGEEIVKARLGEPGPKLLEVPEAKANFPGVTGKEVVPVIPEGDARTWMPVGRRVIALEPVSLENEGDGPSHMRVRAVLGVLVLYPEDDHG
jgi:hypothetical protein